ncbi:hypothetical protein [Microlunatus parietis]|uniref:Nucleotidyl transferase AbiEii toxin, Type IV TA system n=1 Tax=Microlunatus parietis TaxID=682979 RepID=A0A7Y9IBB7_9ACTN|nr:hypothetical protein [Microlunatus parietis]NYE73640.1 hypothetical protein [Microlunatus parietis]
MTQPQTDAPRLPPREALDRLLAVLQAEGWQPAVGGSGLLVALGLADVAHDWDVTVDAPAEAVIAALDRAGLPYRDGTRTDGVYGTDRCLKVHDHLDLMINFALRGPAGMEPLPTRITGTWHGIPLADPAVWARAYRLLGRTEKADLLQDWLAARRLG